jgi:hypothetical protein
MRFTRFLAPTDAMSSPQEQFAELTRRTQENFKTMWQQWTARRR